MTEEEGSLIEHSKSIALGVLAEAMFMGRCGLGSMYANFEVDLVTAENPPTTVAPTLSFRHSHPSLPAV
jgi:hypothetical protein